MMMILMISIIITLPSKELLWKAGKNLKYLI